MPKYTEDLLDYLNSQIRLDENTGELWWRVNTYYNKRNMDKPVGFLDRNGYKVFTISYNKSAYSLRNPRVVFALYNGYWPKGVIDHIDRDKSNDKPSNLRDTTYTNNGYNKTPRGTSKWLGVHLDKSRGNYVASCSILGVKTNLGRFDNPRDAAMAYNYCAHENFPNYANYNKVFEDHPLAETEHRQPTSAKLSHFSNTQTK